MDTILQVAELKKRQIDLEIELDEVKKQIKEIQQNCSHERTHTMGDSLSSLEICAVCGAILKNDFNQKKFEEMFLKSLRNNDEQSTHSGSSS